MSEAAGCELETFCHRVIVKIKNKKIILIRGLTSEIRGDKMNGQIKIRTIANDRVSADLHREYPRRFY